jgi:hypothetical protein
LTGGRVVGTDTTVAKANAWPFLVSWLIDLKINESCWTLLNYNTIWLQVNLRKYSDTPTQFPFFVANYVELCSGTLISDTKVLSAASCLEKYKYDCHNAHL